jgi:tetratricopeptide (TPR) repeat protein
LNKFLCRAILWSQNKGKAMVLIKKKKEQPTEELERIEQSRALQKSGIQDQFQAKGFELIAFFQKHRPLAFTIVSLLICTGFVYLGWNLFNTNSNKMASAQYQAAIQILENQSDQNDTSKKKAAKEALLKVARDHSRSDIAKLAQLYAAHLSFELSDPQEAIRIYQSFLQTAIKKDALRPLALTGLGYAYEAINDSDMALKTFEEMIALSSDVNADNAFWEVARLAKEKGLYEKARENAEIIVKRFPDSPLMSNVRMLLSSLPAKKATKK